MGTNRILQVACLLGYLAPSIGLPENISVDEWRLVHTNPQGEKYFIETSHPITRGKLRRIDFMIEYPEARKHEPILNADKSTKMVKTAGYAAWIDCKSKKMELFSFTANDENGRWVDGLNFPASARKLESFPPDSKAYPVIAPACALEIPKERQNQ